MAKSIGCLWALGITSVSTIISGLLSDMAINSSSRLFGSWSMLVYNRLIFENVTSVSLDLLRLLSHFAVTISPWSIACVNNCGGCIVP